MGWPGTAGAPDDASDGALARRAASGDRAAEEALCRRFRPRIRLYGLRHLRDEAAAADLAQDVLVAVIARLRAGAVREPDRLASFVLSTCRQVAGSAVRTERRREALLAAEPLPAPHDPPAEPLPRDRLARCLEALAARERAVVVATFYAEQPAQAISRDHALSEGHVRVLRHRALRRLRACLGLEEAAG
ncbi:RNA polymerase sigma factor [Anaeromyxobacter sp. Red801]|uniref:RNA polymerase sigma factor n=1 Tax=Anaeromyxobacter sp. Red801 TaxID=3411632 RepID=UPI003BA1C3D8